MNLLIKSKYFLINLRTYLSLRLRGFRDYYNFPFDVSTKLNEYAEKTLEEACSLLESLGVNYYLCDGTILGIVRDDRLIPHDNDIDVSVVGDVDVGNLKKAFISKGYKVGRELYYRDKLQQLIFYSEQNVIFDICFWHEYGDNYYYQFVPELKKGRRQCKRNFEKQDYIIFRQKTYPTHGNIREWLREHFGDDWIVPKTSKADWRLETRDVIQ